MIKITVSGENFVKLLNAKEDETIIVEHVGSTRSISLTKNKIIKKMTISEIEEKLGYKIEIIGN